MPRERKGKVEREGNGKGTVTGKRKVIGNIGKRKTRDRKWIVM